MIEKTYTPKNIETSLYKYWETMGYFKPHGDTSKKSFCMMIPPPNVTGSLHLGHAFQQTIMDIIVRYQRMQGHNTLWQVGTDHAGIATQMIVERNIYNEEGKTREDYGRDLFTKKIWAWKKKSGNNIYFQMRRLGNSVDWDRERFTMDQGFSHAVQEAFLKLYKDNLIYRGKRLVNWDPKLCTAISDLEVEMRTVKGTIWYIRYPLVDNTKTIQGKDYLLVATTRPETLLGDSAIAVHPNDDRYNNLIGKKVLVPFLKRSIPIIGDNYACVDKGTGCVKITPAHDFNDYKVALRHKLPLIKIFNLNGCIIDHAEVFDYTGTISYSTDTYLPPQFQNMERFAARKAIIKSLKNIGLLEKKEIHHLTIPYGDRSGVIIEPMLTDQWYLRTSRLASEAISAIKNGDIQFIPQSYNKMYFSWMENIEDWCISRQLWWGHRIPVWYNKDGRFFAGRNEEEIRKKNNICSSVVLFQDNDVLDTWFSSSLWTFSTLGWPQKTEDLRIFHPIDLLVTGFDIIFFWVARMIMLTMYLIKDHTGKSQIPFKKVYITGLICDETGQKMSKSKGNVIDPLDMIDGISLEELLKKRTNNMMQPKLEALIKKRTIQQFPNGILPSGTDALRFTLAALAVTGRNINWNIQRVEGYRNFCNKLWNASRFVILNTEQYNVYDSNTTVSIIDRWIISELNSTVKVYRESLDHYRFDHAAHVLYNFIWYEFCDWYLELVKITFQTGNKIQVDSARYTLLSILEEILRLAHPIMPFITESIWQRIKNIKNIHNDTIMLQPFPEYDPLKENLTAKSDIDWIKKIVITIRNVRSEMNIPPNKSLDVFLYNCPDEVKRRIKEYKIILLRLANLKNVNILSVNKDQPKSIIKIIEGIELIIPIADLFDRTIELNRLKGEIDKLNIEIKKIQLNLSNNNFLSKAPKYIVEKEKKRFLDLEQHKLKLIKKEKLLLI